MNRNLPGIILLIIIASTTLAGVHAATHATANPAECELCSAYSDPSDAIPGNGVAIPRGTQQLHDCNYGGAEHAQPAPLSIRQRGPPIST